MRIGIGQRVPIDRDGFLCGGKCHNSEPALVTPERTYYRTFGNNYSEDKGNSKYTIPFQQQQQQTTPSSQNNNDKNRSGGWMKNLVLGTKSEPCIATQKGLFLALKHQAPIHVIRFMLGINPNIVDIPQKGPTPLQVAVQHNASLEVIEELLRASPFCLCITNEDCREDPLSYAKRNHKDRPGLIELLSRPLSYWVTESKHHTRATKSCIKEFGASKNVLSEVMTSSHYNKTIPSPNPLPVVASDVLKSHPSNRLNKIDREEINNVKKLCAQLIRGHRKIAKEVVECKKKIHSQSEALASAGSKDQILQELTESQRSQFFHQLIALDMKERAYKARLDKMERNYVRQLENRLSDWTEKTRDQIFELQLLVKSEARVNTNFRNELADWIEECQEKENKCIPSFVFATNMGETGMEVPLVDYDDDDRVCAESDDDHRVCAESDDDHRVCAENDENASSSLNCVKRRPWKPLFKHWDRIMLVDDA